MGRTILPALVWIILSLSVCGLNASVFHQRIIRSVTDSQAEDKNALILQKTLEGLHASDFGLLPLAFQYAFRDAVLANVSGTMMSAVVKVNRGDTVIAYKVCQALKGRMDQQVEFLQSLGSKILPDVEAIIIRQVLDWWDDPNTWKDHELSLLTTSGDPLLAYLPPSRLETLDDELADRFTSTLGQSNDIGKVWWMKPMSLKKAWFELAKGARYFGAVHEWSFRRMQKLSFLLEGASPEDLELVPPIPEIKGLVIGNHYTELQSRVVFDAFYKKAPLSQEDLQEFQFHVLDLTPTQLQRFDLADTFSTLDEMMAILEAQANPSYAPLLQISQFMWPLVNTTTSGLTIAPPSAWQKRELSQIGKMLFVLPKSILFQIPSELINWDSNTLRAIRSNHLTRFQVWYLTSQILSTIDERFKPDYVFMMPAPFQKGIPSQNISQALLNTPQVRPEVLRALIEESSGMLSSQLAVVIQRISQRLSEATIIRNILASSDPSNLFDLFSPRLITKNMGALIKTIMEMPEQGRFGITAIQAKLLPRTVFSLWLNWAREQGQVQRWTAEDLLGRSRLGLTHLVNFAILGLSCREVDMIDPLDILPVILHYRHELYALKNFQPTLSFSLNLRACLLDKVVQYLKIKSVLNGTQSDDNILADLNYGEIAAIGGEILSIIPLKAVQSLPVQIRIDILEKIGDLDPMDLFSYAPLDQLKWYASTLLVDIQTLRSATGKGIVRRQAETLSSSANPSMDSTVNVNGTQPLNGQETDLTSSTGNATDVGNITGAGNSTDAWNTTDSGKVGDGSQDGVSIPVIYILEEGPTPQQASPPLQTRSSHSPVPKVAVSKEQLAFDSDVIQKMGNLLCYGDEMFDGSWPKEFVKDLLESKLNPGEKTCCMKTTVRTKWFTLLQMSYGSDTGSWNEFDLASIGDLLVAVPEVDLMKISRDALANAVSPILKQSGFALKIRVPGSWKDERFIKVCSDNLGADGPEFTNAYLVLMRQLSHAAQFMVNTVKTTQELIKGSVGRTGRLPRWAEFKVRDFGSSSRTSRQIPIVTSQPQSTLQSFQTGNSGSQGFSNAQTSTGFGNSFGTGSGGNSGSQAFSNVQGSGGFQNSFGAATAGNSGSLAFSNAQTSTGFANSFAGTAGNFGNPVPIAVVTTPRPIQNYNNQQVFPTTGQVGSQGNLQFQQQSNLNGMVGTQGQFTQQGPLVQQQQYGQQGQLSPQQGQPNVQLQGQLQGQLNVQQQGPLNQQQGQFAQQDQQGQQQQFSQLGQQGQFNQQGQFAQQDQQSQQQQFSQQDFQQQSQNLGQLSTRATLPDIQPQPSSANVNFQGQAAGQLGGIQGQVGKSFQLNVGDPQLATTPRPMILPIYTKQDGIYSQQLNGNQFGTVQNFNNPQGTQGQFSQQAPLGQQYNQYGQQGQLNQQQGQPTIQLQGQEQLNVQQGQLNLQQQGQGQLNVQPGQLNLQQQGQGQLNVQPGQLNLQQQGQGQLNVQPGQLNIQQQGQGQLNLQQQGQLNQQQGQFQQQDQQGQQQQLGQQDFQQQSQNLGQFSTRATLQDQQPQQPSANVNFQGQAAGQLGGIQGQIGKSFQLNVGDPQLATTPRPTILPTQGYYGQLQQNGMYSQQQNSNQFGTVQNFNNPQVSGQSGIQQQSNLNGFVGPLGQQYNQYGQQGQLNQQQGQFAQQDSLNQQQQFNQFGQQGQLNLQGQGQGQLNLQSGQLNLQQQGQGQGQLNLQPGQLNLQQQGQGQLNIQQGQLNQQGQLGQQQQFNQFGQQGQLNAQGQFVQQDQLGQQQQFNQFGQQGQLNQQQGQFTQQGQFIQQDQLGQQQQFNQFGQQGLNQQQSGQFDSNQMVDLNARSADPSLTNANATQGLNSSQADAPLDEKTRSLDFGPGETAPGSSDGTAPGITCNGIKTAGPAAIGLTIDEIEKLSAFDLFDCIETLGKIEWSEEMKKMLISLIVQKLHLSTSNLKAITLIELGSLVSAFSVDSDSATGDANKTIQISKIDLTLPASLDMLSILGSRITNPIVLKALAEKFNEDNRIFPGFSQGIARPENLRITVLSLGNILCGFSDKIVNSIFESDASLFIDTSQILGRLEGCGTEVLTTLATHAVRPSSYGPPRLWSQEDLEAVGVVFAGLKPDAISTIPKEAMQGLQPLAIRSLPAQSLLAMSADQISKMSYSSSAAISSSQFNSLNPSQSKALQGVLDVQNDEFKVETFSAAGAGVVDPADATRPNEPRSLEPPVVMSKGETLPNGTKILDVTGTGLTGRGKVEDGGDDDSSNASSTTTTTTTTEPPTIAPTSEAPSSPSPTTIHPGAASETGPKSGSNSILKSTQSVKVATFTFTFVPIILNFIIRQIINL